MYLSQKLRAEFTTTAEALETKHKQRCVALVESQKQSDEHSQRLERIVGLLARDALGEWPSQPEGRMLTNIVMMGMGEPLYNFDHVRDALKVVMDGDGLALSKRRITLSTSGVVPMMARAGEEIGVNLAVSLHAITKEVRDEIVQLRQSYMKTAAFIL